MFTKFVDIFWMRFFVRDHGHALSEAVQDCAEGLPQWCYTIRIHFEIGVNSFSATHGNCKCSSKNLILILIIVEVKHIGHE